MESTSRAAAAWRPLLAIVGYVAVMSILVGVAADTIAELMERRAAVAAATGILDRLQGHRPGSTDPAGTPASAPVGSPFLEGPTVTVAGATLMQRVSGAVTRFGGHIMSSRVELQGTPLGAGFLGVTASLEIAQPAFQELLYDLEAGMPFLFVDQLVAQAPTASVDARDGRMRVLLTVYGQWQGEP
ncbi:type II secretion system protein GspM [Rhodoplanes roseus]|uniref:General secretion pathway protein GspM n=1 Tax=Rhodoplanes roseus TaxID=29409 RepID=A0A327L140_9BRAD|nr:type II secretion system protein GspM [Rhodoplanes roseus]RAI43573.1 hypothetical protein CH341_13550 [Rhodoplanes roseus]